MNGIIFFAFLVIAGTSGQYIPQGVLPGNPSSSSSSSSPPSSSCNYQFTVPNAAGACSVTSSNLDQKVDQVKQDLDKTRLQYVAQNSVVQSTLAKVQSDTATYTSRVNDLANQFQRLRQAVSTAPSGSGASAAGNNVYLNQLVHDTKDLLTKAVQDINNKIFNLTYQFQRGSVEQSKVDTAIEKQINQQAVEIAKTEQRIINLENQIKSLQANAVQRPSGPAVTSPPVSVGGPTSAQFSQLKQQYQQLEKDVQQQNQLQTTQFQSLNSKANQLLTQVTNQTNEINTIKLATKGALSRVVTAETKVNTVKTDLDALKKKIEPQMIVVAQEVAALQVDVSKVQTELQQLGTQLMTNNVNFVTDHAKIQAMTTQAKLLADQLNKLTNETASQAADLIKLTQDVKTLTSAPALSGSKPLSSTALQQAVQQFEARVQTSMNQTQADIAQLQQVTKVLVQQFTTLQLGSG
ncbi:fibrinogen- and Ig-binding protein-like [Argopecten irradians]|uniref:fibrinogen- and Ig-binding protein-like n=1 Tax=Argopecten irradians TaxID=31199 RepID=UPI00371E79D3